MSPAANEPLAQVVLLTGPSGCGKSRVTKRLGLPVVPLDEFYYDHDHPGLPRRFGIVDWDDPATWDADGAMAALETLCQTGHAEIPDYSIPTSTRLGTREIALEGARIVIAEGIFAAQLVARCREAGLLGAAVCLRRRRITNFWFRLSRDLHEGRKRPWTLVRRGLALYHQEPALIAKWMALGCQPMKIKEAEAMISELAARG